MNKHSKGEYSHKVSESDISDLQLAVLLVQLPGCLVEVDLRELAHFSSRSWKNSKSMWIIETPHMYIATNTPQIIKRYFRFDIKVTTVLNSNILCSQHVMKGINLAKYFRRSLNLIRCSSLVQRCWEILSDVHPLFKGVGNNDQILVKIYT